MNRVLSSRMLLFSLLTASCLNGGSKMTFSTPEKAANALLLAIQTDNYPQFLAIAGSRMAEFWNSGDPARDEILRHGFADAARRHGFNIEINSVAPDIRMLSVGDARSFPAPLVKTDSGWRFDGEAGAVELTRRRVHRNEIAAVELCRRFRDAELSFFERKAAFAQRIRSTPGTEDGLVRSDHSAADESPIGPAFAGAAIAEHQRHERSQPLFGYYFRILADPFPCPASGASERRDYVALLAWPAQYGVDGVHSFVVNHLGDVYQSDLGADTTRMIRCGAPSILGQHWSKLDGE